MEKYLEKLEFNKIRDFVKNSAISYIGKNLAEKMTPSFNKKSVLLSLDKTFLASSLIYKYGNIPIGEFENVDIFIKTLDSGSSISAKALLEIAKILDMSKNVRDYFFSNLEDNKKDYELLENYFSSLFINKEISKRIFDSILDEDTISDNASPKLSSLRRNKKKLERDIKDDLNKLIHSTTYSKYLMEPIITIRNDRFVIPVKAEYRSKIPGYVLDVSSSGSTLFIEPNSIFDLNNKINNIKADEVIEIEKILRTLSLNLMPYTLNIKENIRIIGELDFLFAKAKYSNLINGVKPNINDDKFINLINARHPLIEKEKIVPISISLGKDFNILIISGPNTGGKTVSLKTVGLMLSMAYSGILIPASENSSIYVFDNIFVDIGDDQSIIESLSTFSSHITNIKYILEKITDNSIFLIDELGSGTDPEEGENLALSILEYLYNKKTYGICTTHFKKIKEYALINDGFEIASSDFNLETLSPTYKILVGVPGKSNAIAISKKLGIPEEILENAKKHISKKELNIEDILKSIYKDKEKQEILTKEIEEEKKEIDVLKKNLVRDNSLLDEKARKIIENAKKDAEEMLLDTKEEVNKVIKELNNSNLKKANSLRNDLNNSLKKVYDNDKYKEILINNNPILNKNNLKVNDIVFVNKYNQIGEIINIPNNKKNEVQIRIGNINTNINISELSFIKDKDKIKQKNNINNSKVSIKNNKSQNISYEINLIGLTTFEAIPILDKYIDDAYLSKLEIIRIIHGKGTGTLRKEIHKYLKTNSHIKDFRIGSYGEGEMGVTIANLNIK